MIKAKLNLNMDMIKSSVREYSNSTNLFHEASYDLIKNKIFWNDFNQNWTEKLALVYRDATNSRKGL
jgi:DNA-binding GntR family transcriptional regulator